MIIVRFTSGLGNQMFQYSLYSYLRQKYKDVPVKADVTWFKRFSEHQGYELERIFKRPDNPDFVLEEATDAEILRCSGRIVNPLKGRAGEIWQYMLRIPHRLLRMARYGEGRIVRIEQTGFEDNAEIYEQIQGIDSAKDYYITGFFIEEIYYKDRLKELRGALSFDNNYSRENESYIRQIAEGNAVSIHVRRGDYLSSQYSSSFLSLPMDYYKKAAEKVREEIKNPRFFIFSDDKEYVKTAFDWIDEDSRVIVEGNTGRDSFRDMQLMSLCQANIIANSTFSVWAGLLNSNENAKVFYPAMYMREKDSELKTIPGWTRI